MGSHAQGAETSSLMMSPNATFYQYESSAAPIMFSSSLIPSTARSTSTKSASAASSKKSRVYPVASTSAARPSRRQLLGTFPAVTAMKQSSIAVAAIAVPTKTDFFMTVTSPNTSGSENLSTVDQTAVNTSSGSSDGVWVVLLGLGLFGAGILLAIVLR